MLNISLPDQVQSFVEEQAIAAGFNSANEYVCHLILREQDRIAQQERIQSLLLEGLESGEPAEATEAWWEQKRTQLVERFQQSDA
ncbi:ribbon-helix-helix domain-containing protein [Pantanalinema sp. GBBB05]|uniref:ribbon-helix-helix domain-containing protein n=1 Tax=Pantanalinema sp. GBBB05 TaxID=2604139 RepID=UPI001DE4A624|nr:type II toxin-antitoxin system ParD family antitoxin [Pantanalinema sp. GBBB05]